MPSRMGYQPTGTELSGLRNESPTPQKEEYASIQWFHVPADDLTDPAAVHLAPSASIVLSRKRASEGLFPLPICCNPTQTATPTIVGQRHYLRAVKSVREAHQELKDIIAMLGMEQLAERS